MLSVSCLFYFILFIFSGSLTRSTRVTRTLAFHRLRRLKKDLSFQVDGLILIRFHHPRGRLDEEEAMAISERLEPRAADLRSTRNQSFI